MECGKTCYTSERRAKEAITLLRKKIRGSKHRVKGELPKRAYYCDKCGFYHLTSHREVSKEDLRKQKKN